MQKNNFRIELTTCAMRLAKMATQQRALKQLLEAFHELNATVALLANQRGACSNIALP
jgi:hypothetical protein